MLTKQLLRSPLLKSTKPFTKRSIISSSVRSFSQVDYSVYKGQQDKFNELNNLKSFRRYNRRQNLKYYVFFFALGSALSYNYSIHELIHKFIVGNSDSTDQLESKLNKLSVVKKYSTDPAFKSARAFSTSDNKLSTKTNDTNDETIYNKLTSMNGFTIPPMTFYNESEKESVSVIYLGEKLSGYPFLVHGGMLNLIIDELFKNSSSLLTNLDISQIHTDKLVLNYKFPTFINSFVVLKTKMDENKETGKLEVKGTLENLSGQTLVKATGILNVDDNLIYHGLANESKNANQHKGWFWF